MSGKNLSLWQSWRKVVEPSTGNFGYLLQRSVFCFFCAVPTGGYVICPICEKRKGARFCPAKGETICAVCCGTGREVTIDCAPDCSHLLAANRYEDEHPRSLPPDTPLLDINLPSDVVHTQQQLMAALAFTVA